MLGNRGFPEALSHLCVCQASFLMTFAMGGVPHAGPRQELDYKESWELKNWCFWTVVLDKTLESPLDCKEIQPVHCQGPAWGTPPMAKVMRKEAWHTQRRDQASGNPLFLSIYPKTRVCFMLSPISLREGVNVQLQGNKNSWAWQERFSLRTPLKVI